MPAVLEYNDSQVQSPSHWFLSPREVIYNAIRATFFRHSRSVVDSESLLLHKRQGGIPIPPLYDTSGPAPGTVVGIVLGSLAGFLLVSWLIMSLTNNQDRGYGSEEVTIERRRSLSRSGSRAPRSRRTSRRSEVREIREISRSPIRRERINIVEERRQSVRPASPVRSIISERVERRVEGDDVVEVIEEHSSVSSPPRRKSQRRSSGYRSYR